jgi:hypothetical protein
MSSIVAILMRWQTDRDEQAGDDVDVSSEIDTQSYNPTTSSQQHKLEVAPTPDPAPHQEVIQAVTSQSTEDMHTWSTFTVTREWFEFDDAGRLTSMWKNDSKNLKISIHDEPMALGSQMDVSIVS